MTSRDAAATRQRILEHARRQFAQHGYTAITVKGVADAAGVSPNLITRYFGGKDGLFLAATRVEIPVSNSFDGDRAALGSRLAASIVRRWFGAPGRGSAARAATCVRRTPRGGGGVGRLPRWNSLEPLHRYLRDSGLDDADARSRAAAIDAFVLGVSTRRRVLRAELGDPADLQAWLERDHPTPRRRVMLRNSRIHAPDYPLWRTPAESDGVTFWTATPVVKAKNGVPLAFSSTGNGCEIPEPLQRMAIRPRPQM